MDCSKMAIEDVRKLNNQGKVSVGQKYHTRFWGIVEVIDYNGHRDITVRFPTTGYTTKTCAQVLRNGQIKDKKAAELRGNSRWKQSIFEGDTFDHPVYGQYEIVKYTTYKKVL